MAFLGSIWTSLSVGRRVLVFFLEEESPSVVQLTTFARIRVFFYLSIGFLGLLLGFLV